MFCVSVKKFPKKYVAVDQFDLEGEKYLNVIVIEGKLADKNIELLSWKWDSGSSNSSSKRDIEGAMVMARQIFLKLLGIIETKYLPWYDEVEASPEDHSKLMVYDDLWDKPLVKCQAGYNTYKAKKTDQLVTVRQIKIIAYTQNEKNQIFRDKGDTFVFNGTNISVLMGSKDRIVEKLLGSRQIPTIAAPAKRAIDGTVKKAVNKPAVVEDEGRFSPDENPDDVPESQIID